MPSRFTSTGRVLALGGLTYRQAQLALLPTYAWIAEDLAAGAVAAWPCAVTGLVAAARDTAPVTGSINGRQVVTFAANGDLMATAISAVTQPYAFVIMVRPTATVRQTVVASTDGAPLTLIDLYTSVTPRDRGFAGAELFGSNSTSEAQSLRFVANGASSQLWRNGAMSVSGNAGTVAWHPITIGRLANKTLAFAGVIGDILIFSGADYAARAASAEALMRAYYGI